jgi:hypothetical protein
MKKYNIKFLHYIQALSILFFVFQSHKSYSQFTVNEDSLYASCSVKTKSNKGKKILKGLASATLGLPQSNETTYEDNIVSVRDGVAIRIIELASQYDQYNKAISSNKYISARVTLDAAIGELLRRNFQKINSLKNMSTEQLESADNKVLLCILNSENQIIDKELRYFNDTKFMPVYLEAQKVDRERIAKEESEKDIKRQEKQKEAQAANEKFIQEHVEWRKTAKYSFKIDYIKKVVTKECRFCYHECAYEETEFNAPDFKKYGDKEHQHLYLAYLAFKKSNESKLGSYDGCLLRGCKESNSGEHTWKAIKTEEKSDFIFFKVGQ